MDYHIQGNWRCGRARAHKNFQEPGPCNSSRLSTFNCKRCYRSARLIPQAAILCAWGSRLRVFRCRLPCKRNNLTLENVLASISNAGDFLQLSLWCLAKNRANVARPVSNWRAQFDDNFWTECNSEETLPILCFDRDATELLSDILGTRHCQRLANSIYI